MDNRSWKDILDDHEKESISSKFLKAASKWAEREGYYQEAEYLLKSLKEDE